MPKPNLPARVTLNKKWSVDRLLKTSKNPYKYGTEEWDRFERELANYIMQRSALESMIKMGNG